MLSVLPGGQGVARQPVSNRIDLVDIGLFPEAFLFETVADFAVVDAKEFGHTSGHVHIVRLALGALLVQKLVDRIIWRLELQQDRHNDE